VLRGVRLENPVHAAVSRPAQTVGKTKVALSPACADTTPHIPVSIDGHGAGMPPPLPVPGLPWKLKRADCNFPVAGGAPQLERVLHPQRPRRVLPDLLRLLRYEAPRWHDEAIRGLALNKARHRSRFDSQGPRRWMCGHYRRGTFISVATLPNLTISKKLWVFSQLSG
jgi:hypothetical protein